MTGFRIDGTELATLLDAKVVAVGVQDDSLSNTMLGVSQRTICKFLFDTRQASEHSSELQETVFLALQGKRDGHDFVPMAYQLGIRQFLVTEIRSDWNVLRGSFFYCVSDTIDSLQTLASWYRSSLRMPVVGITGSNGKTIVKEWMYELLREDFGGVYRSPRSFNSQLGVAISILEIPKNCGLAIIEAGISAPGEMARLHRMIQPNLVVFTHLGDAHEAGFASVEQKISEKLVLAEGSDVLIYPYDFPLVREEVGRVKQRNMLMKTMSWGSSEGASFRLLPYVEGENRLRFIHRSVTHEIPLPQSDKATRDNCMSVLLGLVAFERWDPAHINRISSLPRLQNRLALVSGKRGNAVINDSYSADVESLAVALEFLHQQSPHQRKVAVLADFDQLSMDSNAWISRIRSLLDRYNLDQLFLVGERFAASKTVFEAMNYRLYSSVSDLLGSGDLDRINDAGILIKGAHRFGLDRVVEQLRDRHHGTFLEIDLSALAVNYQMYRSQLSEGAKIMCMVKAFGYGSGSYEAAKRLDTLGVDYLGVAYLDEGIALRKAGVKAPIMVMNVESSQWELLKEYRLEPVLYSVEIFHRLLDDAYPVNSVPSLCSAEDPLRVHLELDTGMHRLGFAMGELSNVLPKLTDQRVKIASVFSHLSASEDQDSDTFTQHQIRLFSEESLLIERILGYSVLKHIDNSAGIVRFPEAQFNMVRLGIGLYGIDPSGQLSDRLVPVNRLLTEVSQIRTVKSGEGIGYGMHDVSSKDRQIAVIRMGYADGLWRIDGRGNGWVGILGKRAPLVGNICMDMAMVDVSEIPECRVGTEVEIFGKVIRVEEVSARRNTIPYEVLTSVSQRVNRVFVEG